MPKYLVQLTQEGGPDGTKVIEAHEAMVSNGSVAFWNEGMQLIAAFTSFQTIVDIDAIPTIEADTAAFNTANP
jgi:hypothetical protein